MLVEPNTPPPPPEDVAAAVETPARPGRLCFRSVMFVSKILEKKRKKKKKQRFFLSDFPQSWWKGVALANEKPQPYTWFHFRKMTNASALIGSDWWTDRRPAKRPKHGII